MQITGCEGMRATKRQETQRETQGKKKKRDKSSWDHRFPLTMVLSALLTMPCLSDFGKAVPVAPAMGIERPPNSSMRADDLQSWLETGGGMGCFREVPNKFF